MDLNECRAQIDKINNEILDLFLKRMEISTAVADYKQKNNMPILQKDREKEILNLMAEKSGDEFAPYSKILFSVMMNLSRSYQATKKGADSSFCISQIKEALADVKEALPSSPSVACQGIEGAYSHLACNKIFDSPKVSFYKSFEDVFSAIERGECKYGLLPIENCLHGSVNSVYDLMRNHNFFIVKGIKLEIGHTLLGKKGASLEDITDIYSHEQAIGQCSDFLKNHPDIKVHICENTAMAAKAVSEADGLSSASISSLECAELYNLSPLCTSIANSKYNYTRFICISKDLEIYEGSDKISLMLSLPHEPGSLFGLISKFAALNLNITKLESRPTLGSDFEYLFYFDVEASVFSEKVLALISELNKENSAVFLGSYSEL
ncbi:MAG: chorismate mutase [Clostridia bacterium]|nr:chorismate mutase [Clostridia bacterium]